MTQEQLQYAWNAIHLSIREQLDSEMLPEIARTRRLAKQYTANYMKERGITTSKINQVLRCIDFKKLKLLVSSGNK